MPTANTVTNAIAGSTTRSVAGSIAFVPGAPDPLTSVRYPPRATPNPAPTAHVSAHAHAVAIPRRAPSRPTSTGYFFS